jgi:hypothetical protein
MTAAEQIVIAGFARVDFEPVIPRPLEDIIYSAASAAVGDAGMTIKEIDAVSMASSDILDGRAISTMTLTGSTGSFQKSEMRVCSDGINALALAVAECRAGFAERILVGAWSKLSEGDAAVIDPLSIEPIFHRPLGLMSSNIHSARVSAATGTAVKAPARARGGDGAVALVVCEAAFAGGRRRGVVRAVDIAFADAGITAVDVGTIWTSAFHDVRDDDLRRWCRLPSAPLKRSEPVGIDIGYAAGLNSLIDALTSDGEGIHLVVSASGSGYQSGFAVVVAR